MAQTAEAVETMSFRGRRPGVSTLDTRLEEAETSLKRNGKIGVRRLAELHESLAALDYHYSAHKENGEKVNEQIKRVQVALEDVLARIELPGDKPKEQAIQQNQNDPFEAVRRIRETRQTLLDSLETLRIEEEALYPEIGRKAVEDALG